MRSAVLLQQLMEMHDAQHANVRELALGLTWNISVRDIGLESQLTMMGVSNTLIRCVTDKCAPCNHRCAAAGDERASVRYKHAPNRGRTRIVGSKALVVCNLWLQFWALVWRLRRL